METRLGSTPEVHDPPGREAAADELRLPPHALSLFPDLEPEGDAPFRLPAEEVLESMSDAFVFLDREERFRYVNGRAEEAHRRQGVARERVLGRTVWEVFPALAGTGFERALRAAARTRRPAECEVQDAAGEWCEYRFHPAAGGVACYSRDVTERRRLQAEQALLAAAGEALAGTLDAAELLRRVPPLGLPLLGTWCLVYLLEPDGRLVAVESACTAPEKEEVLREVARRFARSAAETHPYVVAVRTGEPQLVARVTDETYAALTADPEYRARVRLLAPTTLMSVPLVARGRTLGALSFASDRPGRRFGERDLAVARELAARVALAFDNARLYRDATAAAAHAESSGALLDALFRAAPIGLAFVDAEMRYVAVNDALAAVNGLPAYAHAGRTVREVVPGCAELVEPRLARVLMTGEPVLDWEWSGEVPGRPGEVRHWLESFYPVRAEGGAVVGVGVTLAEITAQKRAEDTQRFLSDASRLVAPLLDRDAWLARIPRAALPRLGDFCVLDLAGEDGRVHRTEIAHVDPDREEAARELRRVFPLDARGSAFPVLHVLRTGEEQVVLDAPADHVERTVGGHQGRRALMSLLAPRSYVVLPLLAGGRRLGAMSFVMTDPGRRHTAEEVELARELVGRVALALDNARLFEAEQAAGARMSRLFSITAALSGALTPGQVARGVVRHGMRDLGAHQGMLALPAEGGGTLELVGPEGVSPRVIAEWFAFPVTARIPLADAYRTGREVLVQSVAEYDARYPHLAPTNRETGNRAIAALPLEVEGRVLGALAFAFAEEREFTAADRAFLQAIARQCAQALERARLYDAERRARAEAEGANRAKGEFLATMSHELRTPLNAIGGYTQILELGIHGPVNDAQLEALHRIQRNQRHLLGLINDVLNFARIESGRLSLKVEAVDAAEAVAGVEPLVAPLIGARGLRFSSRVDPGAGIALRADRERLQQVLLNLLSNAVKFTEPGGSVAVEAERAGERVELRVRDTGVGIPAEKRAEVFEPFVQLDRGLTRTSEGAGLGLAISRDLARAMGGDLAVDENPGGGSVFTVSLPAA